MTPAVKQWDIIILLRDPVFNARASLSGSNLSTRFHFCIICKVLNQEESFEVRYEKKKKMMHDAPRLRHCHLLSHGPSYLRESHWGRCAGVCDPETRSYLKCPGLHSGENLSVSNLQLSHVENQNSKLLRRLARSQVRSQIERQALEYLLNIQ